ncbi:MAG: hypothetical protein Q7T36_04165 [Fluviicoccus sp.]|uniref:hypothetical protein n=1 Tax=Fluviicoccus sp. TaxID=2003552 RepID=UPI00271ABC4B|nr:hypothetical protein [Fluviicoccus sp.]MDO8329646.1 hypothetical protein [Fluviicoccus sp.]
MIELNFYVDEKPLILLPLINSSFPSCIYDWILSIVELQEDSFENIKISTKLSSDWLTQSTINNYQVFDLIYSQWSPNVIEEIRLLQIAMDRCDNFDPIEYIDSPAIQYSHAFAAAAMEVSPTITIFPILAFNYIPDHHKTTAIINSTHDIPNAVRQHIIQHRLNQDDFMTLSKIAFPNLYLHEGVIFNKFRKPYAEVLPHAITHLSFLNDHAQLLFKTEGYSADKINQVAAATYNISLSPESPNTHRNIQAMREREISIADSIICCEWHTKFTYDWGRIHFHIGANLPEPVKTITQNKVIIGIFADHLTV